MKRKFDPKVFQLGYVALETADIERTKDHYLENIGMTQTAKGDDGAVFLSIGYNHHDIVLRPAKQKALLHIGLHLKPGIVVSDLAHQAREFGLAATIKTALGARSGLFIPELDALYVAVPHHGSQQAEIRQYAPQ